MVDLFAEDDGQWEEPLQEWTDAWTRGEEAIIGQVTRRVRQQQQTSTRPLFGRIEGADDQAPFCLTCTEPYTIQSRPAVYNSICGHKSCEQCCLTWMTTAIFDDEGRSSIRERVFKSGVCYVCKEIQGTWTRECDGTKIPSRGKRTFGFWERNQTLTGQQVKEVRILNGSLWNCLAIHYRRPSQVITSFNVLSKKERHRLLLAFFLEHAEGTQSGSPRRDFTCRSCATQTSLEKRCIRFSCPMDCKYRIFCFECAWKYTRAI